ncbi:MAG: haloacid dehalogenase-like hydrolase [Candidatus Aminicenantes bacterium]|nr:haloacid dehalogenase-like hydrolase [Candidatus Aminicenantes bacterium]
MKRTVVFDFDKTLTYKDSLFGFFKFCAPKNAAYPFKTALFFFLMAVSGTGLLKNERLKNAGIRLFLSRLNKEKLEEKSRTFAAGIKLNRIYYENFKKKHASEKKVIVTASFSLYVKPIFPEAVVAATEISFKENHPFRVSFNCWGNNKRARLKELGIDKIDVLYTDSLNDRSLIEIADTIYKVRKETLTECRSLSDFRNF